MKMHFNFFDGAAKQPKTTEVHIFIDGIAFKNVVVMKEASQTMVIHTEFPREEFLAIADALRENKEDNSMDSYIKKATS